VGNSTLHIITDSREPSVTCAAQTLRTEFPAHEIQVNSARATDMKTALMRMREQFNDGDHILITMLSVDRREASRALQQSLSGLEPHTSWYASQYEEKIPSRGTLSKISKLCDTHGIRYEINKFEKKRTLPKMSGEEEPEQIWERVWIQYRLMRAIVCGQKLEEAIRDILETLQLFSFEDKKIIPRKSNRGLGDKKSRLEIEYLKYIINAISDLPKDIDSKLRPGPISAGFGIGQQAMKEKLIAAKFECTGK